MRLSRTPKPRDEAHVDLTPMMDIVFIMLIFFIVSSSFVTESGVEVNRPEAENASAQDNQAILVAITSSNEIYIRGRFVDIERLKAVLMQMTLDKPSASLLIQADKRAFNGTVVEVMDAAKGAGIGSIALATEKNQ